ncbi:XRE family transcriptional regulator [Brevibacterium oceani]|uniref:XRE family transcriptional regulator n=1 Tax=Brevibacterium oceani TaxID=358099 RepID=UPI001B324132|nr:XRE family transcriptional regulator [Brevibacterium oceani]
MLNPARITLARELRGLTKAAFAAALGVSSRTVRTFESDGAPMTRAADMAGVLDVSEAFFSLPDATEVSLQDGFFRSLRSATASQRASARASASIGTDLYRFITDRFQLPHLNLPEEALSSPEQAARSLRAAWGRGTEPLPNLIQLSEAHGVRVMSLPVKSQTVHAFSFVRDHQAYVFLSTEKTAERSRFDLAHELGHLVMHTHQPLTDDADSAPNRELEREADRFAAEFLMPEEAVLPRSSREPAVPEILKLKGHFHVSAMAMTKRLHTVGRATDWTYRKNCSELTKRGFKADEPEGMPRERSRVFDVVFPALRNKGNLEELLSNELGISLPLVHELSFAQVPISLSGGRETVTSDRPKLTVVKGSA